MEGRTSCVIHLLNFFASGFLESNIILYNPLSFITDTSCCPPRVSIVSTPFSSVSKRAITSRLFLIPKTSHTSFATHQTLPYLKDVLTSFPSKLKVLIFFIILMNILHIVVEYINLPSHICEEKGVFEPL